MPAAATLFPLCARNTHRAYNNVLTGNYSLTQGLVGFEVSGKTVGIIGTGKIGTCVARMMLVCAGGRRVVPVRALPRMFATCNIATCITTLTFPNCWSPAQLLVDA